MIFIVSELRQSALVHLIFEDPTRCVTGRCSPGSANRVCGNAPVGKKIRHPLLVGGAHPTPIFQGEVK